MVNCDDWFQDELKNDLLYVLTGKERRESDFSPPLCPLRVGYVSSGDVW